MENSEHDIVLLMKYIYEETKKGRTYLRECNDNPELVKQQPEFWDSCR